METGIELKFILGGVLFFALIALFYVFFFKFIFPRIALLFDRFHDSYKHCIRFIKSSENIKEQLGHVIKIQSLPVSNPPMKFAKYRFRIQGSSRNAILNIIMHWARESKKEGWVFVTADFEVEGEIIDLRASHISLEQ